VEYPGVEKAPSGTISPVWFRSLPTDREKVAGIGSERRPNSPRNGGRIASEYATLRQGHVDHRRLDVGVAHRLHDEACSSGKATSLGWVDDFGYALYLVQIGGKPPNAKPWKGEGPGVFEIIEDHRGDTYRAVYTVRFSEAVYVLHCFQKKSPSGIRTARVDQNLIRDRLRAASEDYEVRYGRKKT